MVNESYLDLEDIQPQDLAVDPPEPQNPTPVVPKREPITPNPYPVTDPIPEPEPGPSPDPTPEPQPNPQPFPTPPEPIPQFPPDVTF